MTRAMQNSQEGVRATLIEWSGEPLLYLQRSMTVGVVADDAKRNNDLEPKWLRII